LLCGQKQFMEALVAQLDTSGPDDLLQVDTNFILKSSFLCVVPTWELLSLSLMSEFMISFAHIIITP